MHTGEWVSVADRLPPMGLRVWVYNDSPWSKGRGTEVTIAALKKKSGEARFYPLSQTGSWLQRVTHWAPLRPPAPPPDEPPGGRKAVFMDDEAIIGLVRERLAQRRGELRDARRAPESERRAAVEDLGVQVAELERLLRVLEADTEVVMSSWEPIDVAPKDVSFRDGHGHGPRILGYIPARDLIVACHWWTTDNGGGRSNFIDDGGNAVFPSHWMPLPAAPAD